MSFLMAQFFCEEQAVNCHCQLKAHAITFEREGLMCSFHVEDSGSLVGAAGGTGVKHVGQLHGASHQ